MRLKKKFFFSKIIMGARVKYENIMRLVGLGWSRKFFLFYMKTEKGLLFGLRLLLCLTLGIEYRYIKVKTK